MKRVFFLSLLSFFACLRMHAQDTIIKTDRQILVARILEIGTSAIRYKLYNSNDSAVYIESKQNVAILKLANGVKEVFNDTPLRLNVNTTAAANTQGNFVPCPPCPPLPKPDNKIDAHGNIYFYHHQEIEPGEAEHIMLSVNDPQITYHLQEADKLRPWQLVGFGAIPFGIASLYSFTMYNSTGYNNNYNNQQNMLVIAGACLVVAVACPIAGGVCRHNRDTHVKTALNLYNERY